MRNAGFRWSRGTGKGREPNDAIDNRTVDLAAMLELIIQRGNRCLGTRHRSGFACDGDLIATAGEPDIETLLEADQMSIMIA